MAAAPSEQIKYQTTAMHDLVAGVKPDQWSNPTPCEKWTVRDVVNHLVGGGQMIAASFRGEPAVDADGELADLLGDDPVGAIDATIAAVNAAADAPGAMDEMVVLPFATLPAEVAMGIAKFDILVHCYDLSVSTGQSFDPPADVVAEGRTLAEMLIQPELRGSGPFGDELEAPAGATPMQQLAAFCGRTV